MPAFRSTLIVCFLGTLVACGGGGGGGATPPPTTTVPPTTTPPPVADAAEILLEAGQTGAAAREQDVVDAEIELVLEVVEREAHLGGQVVDGGADRLTDALVVVSGKTSCQLPDLCSSRLFQKT